MAAFWQAFCSLLLYNRNNYSYIRRFYHVICKKQKPHGILFLYPGSVLDVFRFDHEFFRIFPFGRGIFQYSDRHHRRCCRHYVCTFAACARGLRRPPGQPIPQKDHPDSLCHPAASRNRAVFLQNVHPDRTSLWDQHCTAAAYDSFHQRTRHGEHQPGSETELRTCAWNGLCRLCSHLLCTRDHHRQNRRTFHPCFRDDHHRPVTWLPDRLSFRQDTESCPGIIRQQKPGKSSSVFPEIHNETVQYETFFHFCNIPLS